MFWCTPGVTLPLRLAPCEPGVLDTSQLPMHTFLSAWKKQTANTGEKELLSVFGLKSLCCMQAALLQFQNLFAKGCVLEHPPLLLR